MNARREAPPSALPGISPSRGENGSGAVAVPVPANLEPYVRVLGEDLAIAFLTEFGGAELYLPSGARRNRASPLVRLVGPEKAAALAEAADRLPRRVPLGKRWIARVYQARGLSTAEIARRLRASDVAVRGWLKAADDRQLSLL